MNFQNNTANIITKSSEEEEDRLLGEAWLMLFGGRGTVVSYSLLVILTQGQERCLSLQLGLGVGSQ